LLVGCLWGGWCDDWVFSGFWGWGAGCDECFVCVFGVGGVVDGFGFWGVVAVSGEFGYDVWDFFAG